MNPSLEAFRGDLREMVLAFVWQQWSSVGVMAAGGADRTRVVDPEPLLLLTLEVARQDPRMFDEVMDWLLVNGKWINVVRLVALFGEDKTCSPEVLGAVAATLAQHDKSPKWRAVAKRFKRNSEREPESLFVKQGQSLLLPGSEIDETFRSFGLLRSPVVTRGMSAPVVPSQVPKWNAANFIFKARALFGVNIRADVFAFVVLQGAANPTRIARELGYSQRRVQDALADMAAADVFKVRSLGKAKEYYVDSGSVLGFLGATQSETAWFDWRALTRALVTIWQRAFDMQEAGLTPYLLESEQAKVLREVKNDLLRTAPRRPSEIQSDGVSRPRAEGLLPTLQRVLLPPQLPR